jgi:hypothetical protein
MLRKREHEAATAHKSRPSSQPKTAAHTSFGSLLIMIASVCLLSLSKSQTNMFG